MTGKFIAFALSAGLMAAGPGPDPAVAQPYPVKPVRLIVAAPAGAGPDVVARILAQGLLDDHGWRFIVDNRSGASGRIGVELAAQAPADGYTLLLGTSTTNALMPSAVPNLRYDTLRDFAPISLVATSDYFLVAHPSLPVKSVKDLIALARSRPGQIRFASVGNISGAHVAGELLKQLAGIDLLHVPYKGASPAMVAVLSGEVSLFFGSGGSVAPHAKTGKLRLIATAGKERSRMFPDYPTVGETVPGHEATLWYGMFAPKGTPGDIISKLNSAFMAASATPRIRDQFAGAGMESVHNPPDKFAALIKAEIIKWGKVVKMSGTPLE